MSCLAIGIMWLMFAILFAYIVLCFRAHNIGQTVEKLEKRIDDLECLVHHVVSEAFDRAGMVHR